LKNIKDEIKNRLSKLGVEQSENIAENEKNNDLRRLEKKHDLSFPEHYREFIINFNHILFEHEIEFTPIESTPFTTTEGKQSIDELYGIGDLSENLEVYQDWMPNMKMNTMQC